MAAYLSGSSVKGDSVQTLYLMNPSYTAYSDSSNSGNMVLLGPTTGLVNQDLLGNPGQQPQQPYAGFSLPQTVHQQIESAQEIFANRLNNQGYGWHGGNELLFLPASDIRGDTQSLSARLNSFNTGQNQASSITSHLDTTNISQSSFHEQVAFIPSGAAVGLATQSLQTSTGAGQILSLSLSPQQPSLNQLQSFPIQHPELAGNSGGLGLNSSVLENFPSKGGQWMGNALTSLRTTPILGSGFQGHLTGISSNGHANVLSSSPYTSKYLKPAQQLLNEVVSVGKVSKSGYANQAVPQPWATPNSFGSAHGQEKNSTETSSKDGGAVVTWGNRKEGTLNLSGFPTAVTESQEQNLENLIELTAADRQELQIKKAKLLAMVDEVDQRYRQYHHQMQMVVASFEATAGPGAAQTYTALALQTISKHFKCLKDAIRAQIRVACKALGEDVNNGHGRGETSGLRFIDQQLRQQRAFQQLGMLPQHPWRPQRGLPERSVSVLRAWLFEHFLHPYPKDSDKVLLARQTGLSRNQVSNWFINARVRLWKPMVEEMYADEMKDEKDTEGLEKPVRDQAEDGRTDVGSAGGKNVSDSSLKQGNVSDFKSMLFLEGREAVKEQDNDSIQNKILTSRLSDSLLLPEREGISQGLKRARSDLTDDWKMKSSNPHSGHALVKPRSDDAFGIPSDVNIGSYGILQLSGLNRYSGDRVVAAPYPISTAVSLTLGLQHSEGLSVPAVQQNYVHGQSQLHMERIPEAEMNAINFYGVQDVSGGHTGNFEVINNDGRKRFTGHMLHRDFA